LLYLWWVNERAVLPVDLRGRVSGVLVTVSVSTLDDEQARLFEPVAPKPLDRIAVLEEFREQGMMAGIAYMPLLPYISDTPDMLEAMVKTARDQGVDYVFFSHLTLDSGVKERFYKVLEKHYPELIPKYNRLYKDKPYPDKTYRDRLYRIIEKLCREYKVKQHIL